jgi:hypothetical protein
MSDIIHYQFYKKSGSNYSAMKAGWKSKLFRPYFSTFRQSWYCLVQIILFQCTTDASYVFYRLCRKLSPISVLYNYLLHIVSPLCSTIATYILYHLSSRHLSSIYIIISVTLVSPFHVYWSTIGAWTKPQSCSISLSMRFKFPIPTPDMWSRYFLSNYPGNVKDFALKMKVDGSFP